MSALTIIMYHYVRELSRSRYPAIKARTPSEFRSQLDYIERRYRVVTAEEVMAAVAGERGLPQNAAWLTFDDGYLDHYTNVFPLLHERGWQGSFFPPARAVLEGELLDVNKIHFILAARDDPAAIVARIRDLLAASVREDGVRSFGEYWSELAAPSRFDPAPVVFIKHLLQHALPDGIRSSITDALFRDFVAVDPAALAGETYMTADQVRTLIRSGMYVGSHGYRHCWLDRLPQSGQREEISQSLQFLRLLGAPTDHWIMCYPYGVSNDALRGLLRENGCVAGVTTDVRVAGIGTDDPLLLPRMDTNDIPLEAR